MSMEVMAVTRYGPLQSLARMTLGLPRPRAGEVRVRVQASALNPADFKVLQGRMKFLHARNFPLVLGYDFSGTVDACGPGVTDFRAGHDVFGFLPYGPGNRRGAFAEALIARVSEIAPKSADVSHAQAAAAATPGVTALQSLRDLGRLQPGQRVLITGVSGGVGSIAVGIARRLDAEVTAIGSGRGLELARSAGAECVIDRRAGDVLETARGPFHVILDAAASHRWRQWRTRLVPGGTYVTTLPSLAFVVDKLASVVARTRTRLVMVKSRPADLQRLDEWLASGLTVPVDHVVAVQQVAEGLAALERGGVLGRIVVDVSGRFDG